MKPIGRRLPDLPQLAPFGVEVLTDPRGLRQAERHIAAPMGMEHAKTQKGSAKMTLCFMGNIWLVYG